MSQHEDLDIEFDEILFSKGTYQVRIVDPKDLVEYWPFLQLDDDGNIKDAFCSCSASKECIHLQMALQILMKLHRDVPWMVPFQKCLKK